MPSAPMLFDASWAKLAHDRENLCRHCFFQRVADRGVAVTLADLRPCEFNCFRSPLSWFDLFSKDAPPELVKDWQRWREGQDHWRRLGDTRTRAQWLDDEWEKKQQQVRAPGNE